jgi:cell wall-associated NlpC family hydrolase
MKLIQSFILCLLTYFFSNASSNVPQKAIINVPIADLLGQPIATTRPNDLPQTAYNTIALCGGQTNSPYSCPRLHQILYNDIVDVVKTTDDEAYIRITHAYYVIPSSPTPSSFATLSPRLQSAGKASKDKQAQYWTLKKNITLLDDLTAHNIPINHLPEPITFSDKDNLGLHHNEVVTLTEPHHDATLRITFSAGTRFVRVPSTSKQKKRGSNLHVFAIDYKKMKEHQIKIPRSKCIIADHTKTSYERITDYVNLLKKWCHNKQGCIPYTWGGTSFAHTTRGNFKEVTRRTHNSDYSFYEYEKDISSPKSGFDCSGVIARATQICGIPYFCKNTATIPHCLAPLKTEQTLSCGDLILIRGHVMVVSDIAKNLLIEARSYGHGYGKLHEISIGKVFEGIETYKDLADAYFGKSVIKRKDKQGKVRDTFTNLQLFSMTSVWK